MINTLDDSIYSTQVPQVIRQEVDKNGHRYSLIGALAFGIPAITMLCNHCQTTPLKMVDFGVYSLAFGAGVSVAQSMARYIGRKREALHQISDYPQLRGPIVNWVNDTSIVLKQIAF